MIILDEGTPICSTYRNHFQVLSALMNWLKQYLLSKTYMVKYNIHTKHEKDSETRFPYINPSPSWLITEFVTRVTHTTGVTSEAEIAYVDRCLSFFFWSLRCLSFFDILIVITPLVSSNSSYIVYDIKVSSIFKDVINDTYVICFVHLFLNGKNTLAM